MNTASHPGTDALNAWVDQELPDTERVALASHLATCARCRREVNELGTIKAALATLPQVDPPRSFQLTPEQAAAAKPGAATAGSVVRLLPIVRALSIAAVMALLVVSGALWFDPVREQDPPSDPSFAAETAAAPEASMRQEAAATGGGAAEAADEEQAPTTQQEALGAMAPAAAGAAAAPEPAWDPRSTLPATSDEEGTSALAIAAIGLGVLSAVLLGLWFMLARAIPTAGSRR